MLHYRRLTQKAWRWWLDNPTLQQYDYRFIDTTFEDFCVDSLVEIAVDEMFPDTREMDELEADDYITDNFNFNVVNAEELIKEFEREE